MDFKEFLRSLGFAKNEVEVYIALTELGPSSVLELSKKIKVHRTNIYDSLRSLINKGVVYSIDEPTKLFSARSPESLSHFLHQKEVELAELVKSIGPKVLRRERNKEEKITVTKGNFAMREALFSMLENNLPILVYGIPKDAPEKIGPILKEFHRERLKKKIVMKQIYNSEAGERVKFLNKMKYTEAKMLPKKYDSYATTNICGNRVIIFLWDGEITVIEIRDENLAAPYKNYFDILWSKASVVK
jgi:sugar-specific transcriptional regulator TrmB